MPSKPKIIDSNICAKSRLFKIEQLKLEFSNGVQCQFERIQGRAQDAVMIVPMLDDHTILLIREYGAGMGEYVLGFPKGAAEKNEDILVTANRELQEEVGYGAKQLEWMMQVSASPNYFSLVMQIYIARDLYPSQLPGDEPETIEVIPWSLQEIDRLLAHPEFYEARSIAALLLLERRGYGGNA